jgi:hypothetical protein
MVNEAMAAILAVLTVNALFGVILAFNVFGASEWIARSYANIPCCLRLPGQDRVRLYRFTGGAMILVTWIVLLWVALRPR